MGRYSQAKRRGAPDPKPKSEGADSPVYPNQWATFEPGGAGRIDVALMVAPPNERKLRVMYADETNRDQPEADWWFDLDGEIGIHEGDFSFLTGNIAFFRAAWITLDPDPVQTSPWTAWQAVAIPLE